MKISTTTTTRIGKYISHNALDLTTRSIYYSNRFLHAALQYPVFTWNDEEQVIGMRMRRLIEANITEVVVVAYCTAV